MIVASRHPPMYAATAPSSPPSTMPIACTASAISSDARPPYRRRDHSSFPTGSVPRKWPEENAGRLAFRMFPPVGDGTGPMIGQMKQSAKMTATIPAGTTTPSEPLQRPATLVAAASSTVGATPAMTRSLGRSAIPDPWI